MTYYYYTDVKERYGPLTIDELRNRIITTETLIWKEGMADWSPAKNLRELDVLFYLPPLIPADSPELRNIATEKPPKNWLIESVLVTMFCCPFVFGVMAILQSSKVETLWLRGDKLGANEARKDAVMWLRVGLIVSFVIYGLFWVLVIINIRALRTFGGYDV